LSGPRPDLLAGFGMRGKTSCAMLIGSIAILALSFSRSLAGPAPSLEPQAVRSSIDTGKAAAAGRTPNQPIAQDPTAKENGTNVPRPGAPPSDVHPAIPAQPAAAANTFSLCATLQSAARANDLPPEFLTRLIWQESRFRADAISPAGAQGVAQFMPATAAWVRLQNPFDMSDAINKSAELLRQLRNQFGNLGLAAAAYNAGAKRVQDWLAGRRGLPAETQAYVQIVTGHTVTEWTPPLASQLMAAVPQAIACPDLMKLAAPPSRQMPLLAAAVPEAANTGWGVQLLGNASEMAALAAYRKMQVRYRTVLQGHQPLVIRSPIGRSGYWYRVRVAADSLPGAEKLCASLRVVGGSCLVQRN
jgi:hypothetical protein